MRDDTDIRLTIIKADDIMILAIYGAGGLGREVLELAKIINGRVKRWDDFIFVIDGEPGNDVNGVKVYSYTDAIE